MLDASLGNLPTTTYNWENSFSGESISTNNIISISQIGTTNLVVTATNTYGNGLYCNKTKTVQVINSKLPEIDGIKTLDWTNNENSIKILTSNEDLFQYSIDGISFQDNPQFNNLIPGLYTVYIKDIAGCGILEQQVWLLNYPYYFTPNEDGFHDYWFIENSNLEPNFKVYIYDRYGKLLTSFNSNSSGWDGNYNGNKLISDDYWFVIYREDGRILKGHFAMKR